MKRWLTSSLGIGTVLILGISAALGDGLIRDGLSPTATGRGATNIAFSDNAVLLLDNPAGMVNLSEGMLEFGIDTLMTELDYSDPENADVNGSFTPFPVPYISYVHKSEDERWAAGFGVFAPAGFTAEYEMFNPILGQQEYQSLGALVKIIPGVAYQVTDRLSVGANVGAAISHIQLEGPYFVQRAPLTGAPTVIDLNATGVTTTWSLGLQYQLGPRTTVGVAYLSANRFRMEGEADISVVGLAPVPLASNFDAEVDLVWPQSLGVGLKHDLGERHRLGAEVVWFDWGGAFDQIDLRLSDSSNPIFALFGPELRDTLPLDWEDSVSLRFGYEFFATPCSVWRAGYVYNSRTVPDATLNPYLDGVLEHALTVGYGKCWGDWSFNTAYEYSFGPERTIRDSILAGGDFDNSVFEAQAHWLMFSLAKKF